MRFDKRISNLEKRIADIDLTITKIDLKSISQEEKDLYEEIKLWKEEMDNGKLSDTERNNYTKMVDKLTQKEIEGEKKTVGISDRAYPGDIGLNIIRMDGIARRNAKTSIGEVVKVM